MATYDNEQGTCPKCGASIERGNDGDIDGDSVFFTVSCDACGWDGVEQCVIAHQCYCD